MKKFESSAHAQAFLEQLVSMVKDTRLKEYVRSTDKNLGSNAEMFLTDLVDAVNCMVAEIENAGN